MSRVTLRLIFLLVCFCCSLNAFAASVFVIQPASYNPAAPIVNDLKTKLSSFSTTPIDFIDMSQAATKMDDDVLIAPGEEVLDTLLNANGTSPVLAALLSRRAYQDVIARHPNNKRKITALFAEPSPARQIALIKALLDDKASVGMIDTEQSIADNTEIAAIAARLKVNTARVPLNQSANAAKLFSSFADMKTLLLSKDKQLFDVIPLDKILIYAYDNHNLGIIGFSSDLVKNGGLATTYSSLNDTAKSIDQLLKTAAQSQQWPTADYPSEFSVAINPYVMRSLMIKQQSEATLKQNLQQLLQAVAK